MRLKKLVTATLADALKAMKVGETCVAPDGYTVPSVRKTCADLRELGYMFQTSCKTGVQTITRLS